MICHDFHDMFYFSRLTRALAIYSVEIQTIGERFVKYSENRPETGKNWEFPVLP